MKKLAVAMLLVVSFAAPALVSDAAAGRQASSARKVNQRDRRKATAALLRAVPRTKVRRRLANGIAFVNALRAEQIRLETTRKGPDTVVPDLQAEIRQRVLGLDRLLERRGTDYLLNVSAHGEVAHIRNSLRALLVD